MFPDSYCNLLEVCPWTCFKSISNHTSVRRAQINRLIAVWLNLQAVDFAAFWLSLQPFCRHHHINLMNCLHFIWCFVSKGITLWLNLRVELQLWQSAVLKLEWILTASNSFLSLLLSFTLFISNGSIKLAALNLMCYWWEDYWIFFYLCSVKIGVRSNSASLCFVLVLLDIQEFYEVTLLNSQKSCKQKLEEVKHMAEQCENSSARPGFSNTHPQLACIQPEVRKTHTCSQTHTHWSLAANCVHMN